MSGEPTTASRNPFGPPASGPVEVRQCRMDGCARLTAEWSGLCGKHRAQFWNNGMPGAQSIPERTLRPYRDLAGRFLESHAEHPATLAALEWAGVLLAQRYEFPNGAEKHLLAHLRSYAVTPVQVMQTAGAVHLLSHAAPREFIHVNHLDTVTGNKLSLLAPLRRRHPDRPTGKGNWPCEWRLTARRRLGALVREQLGLYWLLAWQKIEAELQAGAAVQSALRRQPF